MSRLCACALGVSVGLLCAVSAVVLGLSAMYFNVGNDFVKLAGSVYIGYAVTFKGIALGALWGFIDGFVKGFLVAVFYNFCAKRCPCGVCGVKDVKTVV